MPKFLKLGMIKEMEIALPSLPEQKRIVSTMDSVREETERLECIYQQKLAALDELTLQRSETSEFSRAFFPRAGSCGVSTLVVQEEVGQAFGFSRRSLAAQVIPTGESQGSADLLQSDLRIFPPGAASCAN